MRCAVCSDYLLSEWYLRPEQGKRWHVTAPILFVKEWTPRFKQSKLFRTSPEKKQTILWHDSRFFIALWRTGEIWKRGFFPSVRRTVHTIPSRKRSFLKALFKPEEFKSAGFRVRVTIKHLKTYYNKFLKLVIFVKLGHRKYPHKTLAIVFRWQSLIVRRNSIFINVIECAALFSWRVVICISKRRKKLLSPQS